MQLPGRLRATTLGDVLGALHREKASGTLELSETSGRVHRVHLTSGLVCAVDVDRASASLAELLRRDDAIDEDTLRRSLLRALASRRLHGEVLVRDFHLAPEVVGRALRRQLMLRLAVLEDLSDAQIRFRVAVRAPRGALVEEPLGASEFLAGRRRAREREAEGHAERRDATHAPSGAYRSASMSAPGAFDPGRLRAYRTLGVELDADATAIKTAYRRLVRTFHPDLHPDATSDERRSLARRFAEVTAAYKSLVA